MPHDPLSPTDALRTPAGALLGGVSLLVLVYSLVIAAQLLLGVLVAGSLTVGLYLTYRTFAALENIADAAQRIAAVREREAERAARPTDAGHRRADREADRSTESTQATDSTRATDSER
jgi:hypothetical protein